MARFIKGDKTSRSGDDSPTEEFDFAAIARDLNAEDGPSSFDSLLSQPANAPAEATGNAAEAISLDELFKPDAQEKSSLEVVPAQAEVEPAALEPEVAEPDLAHSITPPVPLTPSVPVSQPEPVLTSAPAVSPQPEVNVTAAPAMASSGGTEDVETPQSVKRSPLLPIAGGVVIVLLAGGVLMMNRPASQESLPTVPMSSGLPPGDLAPAPSRNTLRAMPVTPKSPGSKRPDASPRQNKKTVGASVSGAPKALTLQAKQQLKRLWNKGRDAKHRGDIEGARRSWQQILKIRPGHPGIQEALDKLPPQP